MDEQRDVPPRCTPRRTKVFISYSHKDSKWLDRLQTFLRPLEREGRLEYWNDTRIIPGERWQDAIQSALDSAQIAVLLVSANFLASDFIVADELPKLLAAANADGVRILPVIVSASRFKDMPNLAKFQSFNPPDQPLNKIPRYKSEELFVELARQIENALNPPQASRPWRENAAETLSHESLTAVIDDATDISNGLGALSPNDVHSFLNEETHGPQHWQQIKLLTKEIADPGQVERLRRQRHELVSLYRHVLSDILGVTQERSQALSGSQLDIVETFFGSVEPAYHELFTRTSFNEPVWQALIKKPQIIGRSWENHIHFSNSLIAEELYADMDRRRCAGQFVGKNRTIRILETGTGACNTTYVVLNRLLNEHWTGDPLEHGEISFEYLGFDINSAFADSGNALFKGASVWAPHGERDARTELHNPRVRPWPGRTRFVERGNAREEIPKLLTTANEGTVDYFFTSYMLHHVPNGDALIHYLCGPPQGIHAEVGDPRREIEYFSRQLRGYLVAPTDSKSPLDVFISGRNADASVADYCAYALAEYLRRGDAITNKRHREYVISAIERTMRAGAAAEIPSKRAFGEDWVRGYFFDPQRTMLRRIYNLLRDNGLIVIADPDGKSGFNSSEMARTDMKAVELAVAHFRKLPRVLDVLTEERFWIVHYGTVVKTRGGQNFDFIPGIVQCGDPDILDKNMGYFVSARKLPVSRDKGPT